MSSYFGTEAQQRLQKKSDRLTPWIMRTPGACLTGRVMGSDDPDRLGWRIILEHLQEDGVFSFRWIDHTGLEQIGRHVEKLGATIHGWQGYCRASDDLRAEIHGNVKLSPDDGLSCEEVSRDKVAELQAFLSKQGITPLSGAVMTGDICRASSVAIRNDERKIVAAGFVGMLQNEHSPLHDHAWIGLIACDADQRGKGLGRLVTKELIRIALDKLGALHVVGFAASDNLASRSMLMGCGLRATEHASYVATLSDDRFTR